MALKIFLCEPNLADGIMALQCLSGLFQGWFQHLLNGVLKYHYHLVALSTCLPVPVDQSH
ncbi:Uncharacterised protein [Klebsiella pneumoniae]|nr:Uncharacterised protein [Klebsiella pneumoniae]